MIEGQNLKYADEIASKIPQVKYRTMEEMIVPKIKELKIEDLKVTIPRNLAKKMRSLGLQKIHGEQKIYVLVFYLKGVIIGICLVVYIEFMIIKNGIQGFLIS